MSIWAGSGCHTNKTIKDTYKPFLPEEMYQKDQTAPTFLQVPEEWETSWGAGAIGGAALVCEVTWLAWLEKRCWGETPSWSKDSRGSGKESINLSGEQRCDTRGWQATVPEEISVRYLEKVFYLEGGWALLQAPHRRGHCTKPDMFSSIWTTLSDKLNYS